MLSIPAFWATKGQGRYPDLAPSTSRRLSISTHTVVSHVKNTYRKLEVHTAASAVMRAIQLGLFQAR
jgi:hypothetical protein